MEFATSRGGMQGTRGGGDVPNGIQFVFQEVAESADDKVLLRLKRPDGVVEEVWVDVGEVSGLEPGARLELIEDDTGTGPRIIRVDREDSP
jgi:hypothetical protein